MREEATIATILYAHRFSSYSQKVLIALYENDTPSEFRVPGDEQAMAELAALWPYRRFRVGTRHAR